MCAEACVARAVGTAVGVVVPAVVLLGVVLLGLVLLGVVLLGVVLLGVILLGVVLLGVVLLGMGVRAMVVWGDGRGVTVDLTVVTMASRSIMPSSIGVTPLTGSKEGQ